MKLAKHYSHNKVTLVRLVLRSVLALAVFGVYCLKREALDFFDEHDRFAFLKSPILVVTWLFFMADFILRLFPKSFDCIGMKKSHAVSYLPTGREPQKKRIRFMRFQALRAFIAYVVCMSTYIIPYILIRTTCIHPEKWDFLPDSIGHWLANVGTPELLVITIFFYVTDIFFIRHWCLFRNLVNKNRCCTTCRIYCWDSIMIVTPLFLSPATAFSAPIILVAFIGFARHEIAFYRHPEYFLEETNRNLQCRNCVNDCCPRGKK